MYLLSAFSTGTTKIIVIDFTSLKKRWPFICLDKPKCLLTIFSDLSLSWQLVCDRWSWVISWLLWKLKPCTRCSLVLNYHLWYMGFVMKASAFWIFLSFFQDNEQKKKKCSSLFLHRKGYFWIYRASFTGIPVFCFPGNFSLVARGISHMSSVKYFPYNEFSNVWRNCHETSVTFIWKGVFAAETERDEKL